MPSRSERSPLAGLWLDPMPLDQALERVLALSDRGSGCALVATVNLSFLRTARLDDAFRDALQRSALALVDGAPVQWLLQRGGHAAERAPGSDLTELLLHDERAMARGMFLLGDTPETRDALGARGTREGWIRGIRGHLTPSREELLDPDSARRIVDEINASGARILLVALGAPHQELWIARWAAQLAPGVGIGVGGSLRFAAWPRTRAPSVLQKLGLEWLHRLARDPRRLLRRYAADFVELARLMASGDSKSGISS